MVRKKILALGLSSGSLLACRESLPPSESQLQIHNGVEINEDAFPAVVLLMNVEGSSKSYCTGVFVNEFQVLTAAHCVSSQADTYLMRPTLDSEGQTRYEALSKAHESHIHPSFVAGQLAKHQANDLAIIDFPPGVSQDFIEVATESASTDSDVTLIGYGAAEVKAGLHSSVSPDKKRSGKNTIHSAENGVYAVMGMPQRSKSANPGKYVSSGFGDSGSPWLIDDKVVSLTIGAELKPQANGSLLPFSYAVDLTSPSNQEFLASWID